MGIWRGLMRGAESMLEGRGPGAYLAAGRKVQCPHCEDDRFQEGRALLNTAGMTFMNLDWANKQATTLACASCGLVQWFALAPTRVRAKPKPGFEETPEL